MRVESSSRSDIKPDTRQEPPRSPHTPAIGSPREHQRQSSQNEHRQLIVRHIVFQPPPSWGMRELETQRSEARR